jgi:hypothetical protein
MYIEMLKKNTYPKSVGQTMNSVGLHAKLGGPIRNTGALIERLG